MLVVHWPMPSKSTAYLLSEYCNKSTTVSAKCVVRVKLLIFFRLVVYGRSPEATVQSFPCVSLPTKRSVCLYRCVCHHTYLVYEYMLHTGWSKRDGSIRFLCHRKPVLGICMILRMHVLCFMEISLACLEILRAEFCLSQEIIKQRIHFFA